MENKKIIIGLAVGVAIAYLLHRRNKSIKDLKDKIQQNQKPQEVKEEVMSSEQDAIAFMEQMKKLGFFVNISPEKRRKFTKEYTQEISKIEHEKVMSILKKPRNKWSLDEVFFYEDNFLNGILMPETQEEK